MPRQSNDYSPSQTVPQEVKSISTKRLYRAVKDCVKKLDTGRQHRRNLISLFQPEQVKLRHKLREACERLMFTHPSEFSRKAEELLWRKVYYDVIQAVKSGRKFQSNAPGALQQRHLEPHYRQFLYSAVGFYHYLLLRVQSRVKSELVDIDFPLATRPLSRSSSLLNDRHELYLQKASQENEEKELEAWVKNTSYRILVCLGDLCRYQMEFGVSRSRPSRYYQLALLIRPGAGMPHNQLATIAGHHYWWGLTAAYHYCRCLHSEVSYAGAERNLQNLLDRNKKLFYQLPTEALDSVITADVYKKEHTRIFILSFLYLCDLLRPKTYATDVETTGLCKRLIDALHVCLNHLNVGAVDDVFPMEDTSSLKLENFLTAKHKSDSKKFPAGSSSGSVEKSPSTKYVRHHNQHKLNGDVVFKICVMCLVNVHDLQTSRCNRSSAAIAFILAFFSHLLGYLIGQLTKPAVPSDDAGKAKAEEENSSKADGDAVNGSNAKHSLSKSKRNKLRLRRRRRGGLNEDNLSEGEEDFLGGGDAAASNSDVSDVNSDDDSATLSDSSGSDARLSQEDISSEEAGADGNENDFYSSSKTNSLPKRSDAPPPSSGSPSSGLAVASLQDLSNKMFQPSTRRKITLAPSFLQNLSPKQDAKVIKNGISKDGSATTEEGSDNEAKKKSTEVGGDVNGDVSKGSTEDVKLTPNENDVNHKQSEEEIVKKEIEAFNNLLALCRHHHVMAAVKLLSDWLAINERVAAACAKNSRALWNRLVSFLNLLPTEREMMKRDEIRNDPTCLAQVRRAIHSLEKNEAERKAKLEEKEREAAKESESKEKKIKIEKRKTTEASQAKKPPPWHVVTGLPEDYTVHMMKAVKESILKTGLDLSKPYREMNDLQQCVTRTCRLRHLCRSLSAIEGVEIDFISNDDVIGSERFTGPEAEVIDPQMELEAVEAMRKDSLMKVMAASRLRNEVQALKSSLGAPKARDSALCLYLVPDTSTLSHELPHLRRLVASERFFVIITKTVIDGLDSLKKDSPGARDAIRYLENEFKKSNRFIRAQTNEESVRSSQGERSKLRRQDMDAWRFYRIIECCRYLMQQEASKANTEVKDHTGLVTILRYEKHTQSQHLASAIAAAKAHGIQTTSAASFNDLWSQSSS